MLDGPALEAFIAIADIGSVRGAAEHLGVTQPALSRRIQRLEDALSTKLFARTNQRLRLSNAGRQLLPHARLHMDGLGRVLKSIRDTARYGTASVTVACLATLSVEILPGVLGKFTRRRPEVSVRVLVLSAREIEQSVRDGVSDLALTMMGPPEQAIVQEFLAEEPMVLLVGAGHDLADVPSVTWSQLVNLPLIAIGPQSANRRLLEGAEAGFKMSLQWRHEVQRLSTAVELVAAGLGAAVVPQIAGIARQRDDVRAVAISNPPITRRLGFLIRSGEVLSSPAEGIKRALASEVRRRLSVKSTGKRSASTVR
jgi:DNA-binding transcriptional LysR family regulator